VCSRLEAATDIPAAAAAVCSRLEAATDNPAAEVCSRPEVAMDNPPAAVRCQTAAAGSRAVRRPVARKVELVGVAYRRQHTEAAVGAAFSLHHRAVEEVEAAYRLHHKGAAEVAYHLHHRAAAEAACRRYHRATASGRSSPADSPADAEVRRNRLPILRVADSAGYWGVTDSPCPRS